MFGGSERIQAIGELCERLLSAGVRLSICSFNSTDVIEPLLREAGLCPRFFAPELIFGWEVCEAVGWRKSGVIRERILPVAGAAPLRGTATPWGAVLFADDNPRNIDDVARAFPGSTCVFVQNGGGMQPEHWDMVRSWAAGA